MFIGPARIIGHLHDPVEEVRGCRRELLSRNGFRPRNRLDERIAVKGVDLVESNDGSLITLIERTCEMRTMNLPRFSAEASLYKRGWQYATVAVIESATEAIRLAQFDDIGLEPLPQPPLDISGPEACSLCLDTCRSSCFTRRNPARCFIRCVTRACGLACAM